MLLKLCTIMLKASCHAVVAYQKNSRSPRPPTMTLWFTASTRVLLHGHYHDIQGVILEMLRVLLLPISYHAINLSHCPGTALRRAHLSLFLHTGGVVVTWPESPALAGSLMASFHVEGPPCVVEGPGDQYELPSWTCTAPHPSRQLLLHTTDVFFTWPESAILVGSLVASFDIEGSPCVLEGPGDQYESPFWTGTAPSTARHLFLCT